MADSRVRLSAPPRVWVVLTLAEADGLVRLKPDPDEDAIRALAKIRTALNHATPQASSPEPSALSPESSSAPSLLRAKDYRPGARRNHFRSAEKKCRMAKAAIGRPAAPAPPLDDDYVPYLDEADGVYR